MPMDNEKLYALYSAHIDEVISEEEEQVLKDYLADNPEAAHELQELKAMHNAFGNMPELPLPEGFRDSFKERLAKEPPVSIKAKPKAAQRGLWKWLAAAACVLIAVIFAGSFGDSFQPLQIADQNTAPQNAETLEYDLFREGSGADNTSALDGGDDLSANYPTPVEQSSSGASALERNAFERKLIKNVSLSLEISDYNQTFEAISALASRYQGYIANSETYHNANGEPGGGYISLRVEAGSLELVLDEIYTYGNPRNESRHGDDVTAQYYDIQSRLAQYQAQKERLLELYGQAESISDLVQIESELGRVNLELDSLEGQLRYYTEMTDLATINISLSVPEEFSGSKVDFQGWGDFGKKLTAAFVKGINYFLNGIANIVLFIIAVLPFIIIIAVILLILILIFRRKRPKN